MTNLNNHHSDYRWLMSLVLRRPDLAERLLQAHRRLTQLPRPWRTRLMWRLGLSMSSATLMLLLASTALNLPVRAEPAAPAYTISVENGQVAIAQDGRCSLIEAIVNANDTKNGRPHPDCAAGNPSGADTIALPRDGQFTLTSVHNSDNKGKNGLPWITSVVTIDGNNSTIQRASTAPAFRLFAVGKKGSLSVDSITLTGGKVDWTDEIERTRYGSAIFTEHDVTITNSTITGNSGDVIHILRDCDPATVMLHHSQISQNDGRAVLIDSTCPNYYYDGLLKAYYSVISDNKGTAIFAIDGGSYIYHSTISGNRGAGMVNWLAGGTLYNSTVSGNLGGGVSLTKAGLRAKHATISNNGGTGIDAGLYSLARIYYSIVSGNGTRQPWDATGLEIEVSYYSEVYDRGSLFGHAGLTARQAFYSASAYAYFKPSSYSIDATQAGDAPTPLDEILDLSLRDNGGPTLTHALVPGSPAIDFLRPDLCDSRWDQRGEPFQRVTNNACDIGAYETQLPPSITNISPKSGPIGTIVTISGANFAGVRSVSFNGVAATSFSAGSATRITATVPAGATTGKVTVMTPSGSATSSASFTVTNPAPTISDFAPAGGLPGTIVTIQGSNLAGTTAVRFNGVAAAFSQISATQVNATVPTGATTGRISITTPTGTATSTSDFIVLDQPPVITGFSPASGSVGTSVRITGSKFTGASSVRFNGVAAATFTVDTDAQITAVVPTGATTGKVSVSTAAGTAESKGTFTVIEEPVQHRLFIPSISR